MAQPIPIVVATQMELKNTTPAPDTIVFLLGKVTPYDGLGGFYRWNPDLSEVEDTLYMKSFPSNLSGTGRWTRMFQRAQTMGAGTLVNNGGVKTFYVGGVTNASGDTTVNATTDGTATGTAIFTEIWSIVAQAMSVSSTPANAVMAYPKALPVDLKTITYGFCRINPAAIVLGGTLPPVAVPAGVEVKFSIDGI